MIDQRRNIFPALAQRRNLDVEDIQAIVKIGTKLAFLNQLFQVLVGSRDDALMV
jgi:hypothetical protein